MSTAAKFYQEQFDITYEQALRIAWFMETFKDQSGIEQLNPWGKGSKARVYMSLWSQNKLDPISGLSSVYYDSDDDDITVSIMLPGGNHKRPLREVPDSFYSGAKTRKVLRKLSEAFDAKKATRD